MAKIFKRLILKLGNLISHGVVFKSTGALEIT